MLRSNRDVAKTIFASGQSQLTRNEYNTTKVFPDVWLCWSKVSFFHELSSRKGKPLGLNEVDSMDDKVQRAV